MVVALPPKARRADIDRPLERIALHRLSVPLLAPYRLAFGVVESYDTIIVDVMDADGRRGFGEATILTGYSDETIDESWSAARLFAEQLVASPSSSLEKEIAGFGARLPFAATGFGTALEMLDDCDVLETLDDLRVPLVGLLSAKDETGLAKEFEDQFEGGYRTFKVKVGFDVENDSRHVRTVQRIVNGKGLIRIDANQGYTAEQGIAFVKSLDPADIELFEQPCAAGDWESHLAVVKQSPVPMMLDESITDLADIDKAAALQAARYIKLKLMKLITMRKLEDAISRIKSLGMIPVLGNGVACDIGCWMEACVAARHIDNAGEMNGHLKTGTQLLTGKLELNEGALRVKAGFAPSLDVRVIDRHRVDSFCTVEAV